MSAAVLQVYVNTDMVLEVSNLKNALTDALITGATVSATVLDSLGSPVVGGSPITFLEVAGFDGLYRGTLPDSASILAGETGTIVLDADGGPGLASEWTLNWTASARLM